MLRRWVVYPIATLLGLILIGALMLGFAVMITLPTLPSLEALTDYRPKSRYVSTPPMGS